MTFYFKYNVSELITFFVSLGCESINLDNNHYLFPTHLSAILDLMDLTKKLGYILNELINYKQYYSSKLTICDKMF